MQRRYEYLSNVSLLPQAAPASPYIVILHCRRTRIYSHRTGTTNQVIKANGNLSTKIEREYVSDIHNMGIHKETVITFLLKLHPQAYMGEKNVYEIKNDTFTYIL
jgi:hypothetical protein